MLHVVGKHLITLRCVTTMGSAYNTVPHIYYGMLHVVGKHLITLRCVTTMGSAYKNGALV